jgi:hypothetical protein
MSQRRSIKALAWAVVARAVPVVAVVLAAYVIARWTGGLLPVRSFGLFYGDLMRAAGWFGMVSLPALAWVLWVPTTRLALRLGFLLVLGVAGWGWLLHRAWVGTLPLDKLDLYRAYPLVTSAVVVLLTIETHLWRWWPRRAALGRASSGTFWSRVGVTLRVVTGCLALLVAAALGSMWTGGPDATGRWPGG